MTERAQKIYDAWEEEWIKSNHLFNQEHRALAAAIREIVNEFQYYHFGPGEDMVVDARMLYELAEELEK